MAAAEVAQNVHVTTINIGVSDDPVTSTEATVPNDLVPNDPVTSTKVDAPEDLVVVSEVNHNLVKNSAGDGEDKNESNGTVPREDFDALLNASSYATTKRDQPVKLRETDQPEKPLTVVSFFRNTKNRIPHQLAMSIEKKGVERRWTYEEYYQDVCMAAKGFIKLGLGPLQAVGILGFNSPEWFLSNLGAIFAGGLTMGIYTTNSPEACQYVANHSQAVVLVVENNMQLQKILQVKGQLPMLKAIIQYSGEVAQPQGFIYSWADFMKLGKDVPDSELEARFKTLAPNKCCTLIYTSGTTGNPKGVMLSHDNLTWTALMCIRANQMEFGKEATVSYLPLSHIAAQMLDIYGSIACGGAVHFAQPDALKGSLGTTLKAVRPTFFFGVPRVWEKMAETLQAIGRQNKGIKKKLGTWAKGIGLKGNYNLMNGQSTPFCWSIAKKLVFDTIRGRMGFDRCRTFLSGAAPITKETLDYFLSLNIRICEVYGMSESSGPHTFSREGHYKVVSVGKEFPGAKTKLDKMDADQNGEICMFGRHVFMGYLDEPGKTEEAVDKDGWLHSGDVGKKDQNDFLFITGRIKELIITAGGENIAPVSIEDAVKEALPIVSNCMLIGDKRKFLAMLITLKTLVDADSMEPQDELTDVAQDWCRANGSQARTVTDIVEGQDAAVLKAIQEGIDRANSKSVSRAAKIQKWSILPRDFSIPGGELGPTLKLRRPIVNKMYSKTIEAFYKD